MQSQNSKSSETRQKTSGKPNEIVEIRYTPLPEEKRKAYRESMRVITMILIEIVDEQEQQDLYIDIFAKNVCVER